VEGPDAAALLDRTAANRLPLEGRMTLAPMLNDRGSLIGDLTIGRLADDRFFLVGSSIAELHYLRWFEKQRDALDVAVSSLLQTQCGLAIAGPRARELLSRVARADVSNDSFPFLSIRPLTIGPVQALVARVSFTGELGYEIWTAPEQQRTLYDVLRDAGDALGLRHFGAQALNSLRLEKGFGSWAREYRPIYTAAEAGLDRFVRPDKGAFIGRDAIMSEKANGAHRLRLFEVDSADADAMGDEPIWRRDAVVGGVTSGGYGHTIGRSLALGYVDRGLADLSDGFDIEILGERRTARILKEAPVDPPGARMRS
ncbi:MAG: aminomethyltransferase family protein, partial [Beijerinckiaceae bacterium]